jgi:peptidoglycan/LPS O-acetylase OafA/YrhL
MMKEDTGKKRGAPTECPLDAGYGAVSGAAGLSAGNTFKTIYPPPPPPNFEHKPQHYIASIQLLRAVAALCIVFLHCTIAGDYKLPSTGAFGVDIFFIISGFIIAFIVSRDTGFFLLKRAIRIVPMYYLATLAAILTVIFFSDFMLESAELTSSIVVKSLLFIPFKENTGYPILKQGWTLNYEVFFYLVMFICIITVKNKKYIAALCAVFLTVFLAALKIISPNIYILNFYRDGLLPEFIYGILLYYCYSLFGADGRKRVFSPNLKRAVLIIMAAASFVFLVFSDVCQFYLSSDRNIYYGIPALILTASLLLLEKDIKDNKIIRFGIRLGEASYVIYLIHLHIVFFFSRAVFRKIPAMNGSILIEIIKLIIAFAVTIILGVMIYRFIDKPIQDYFRKALRRRFKEAR